jgi:hypothetical protein
LAIYTCRPQGSYPDLDDSPNGEQFWPIMRLTIVHIHLHVGSLAVCAPDTSGEFNVILLEIKYLGAVLSCPSVGDSKFSHLSFVNGFDGK